MISKMVQLAPYLGAPPCCRGSWALDLGPLPAPLTLDLGPQLAPGAHGLLRVPLAFDLGTPHLL